MYAFYSLLVYIFYTVFRKEEEEEEETLEGACGASPDEPGPVSMETGSRRRDGHTPRTGKKSCTRYSESSSSCDSDELSDEDQDTSDIPACTPLAAFLSFKQEAEKRRASQVHLEATGKLVESPLVTVMSHLLSFLEQYSHFQQLQQQADQYRVQLKRHRIQHRRQMKALRGSYRQRIRDKNSIISSLEEAISQQQSPSALNDGESSSDVGSPSGVHRLVESLYGLQGERSKLKGDLRLLHSQLEQKESDRHTQIQAFQQQIDELKSCIEEREEELSRLRTAT
ncbi:hypothetical protein ATANTOWER_019203, partial [Ataeniobius toweri]|nr:hypothetical protein [Ataeniobius toweri]